MNALSPEKLIIFDYSGTLSLEAPRFARPETLTRALTKSGLAALGVATARIFWDEIVNPTWIEGSTTPAGYGPVMAKRIAALRLASGASAEEIEAAASRFVESYLDHSRIDPLWQPLLARLSGERKAVTIIATDHYAEATGMIIRNLAAWNIPAEEIAPSSSRGRTAETGISRRNTAPDAQSYPRPVFVANSAVIGSWKEAAEFWKIVKDQLSPDRITRLLVIDDFGFHEEAGDGYGGDPAKITGRQERTRASLREVFQVEAEMIPFFLDGEGRRDDGVVARLIAETALRIDLFLEQ